MAKKMFPQNRIYAGLFATIERTILIVGVKKVVQTLKDLQPVNQVAVERIKACGEIILSEWNHLSINDFKKKNLRGEATVARGVFFLLIKESTGMSNREICDCLANEPDFCLNIPLVTIRRDLKRIKELNPPVKADKIEIERIERLLLKIKPL